MFLIIAAVVALTFCVVAAAGSTSAACSVCHGAMVDPVRSSSHADASCYSCHPGSGIAGWAGFKVYEITHMYPAYLLGDREPTGPVVRTSARACLRCHDGVLGEGMITESRGLRILHSRCTAGEASCDACHSTVAHGRSTRAARGPRMADCVDCHVDESASRECDSCHTSGYERDDLLRGPFAVTHGATWESTHGMGDIRQCTLCHQDDFCVKCHGVAVPHDPGFGATHGVSAMSESARCESCHQSTFCSDCHQIEMPHPSGFLPRHPVIAEEATEGSCERCHSAEDCVRCHEYHVHPGGAKGVPVPPPAPAVPGDE